MTSRTRRPPDEENSRHGSFCPRPLRASRGGPGRRVSDARDHAALFELTPWTIHAVVVDLIAGGDLELLVSFREGCGNSGCWTYLLEVRNGTWQVIIYTVLPDAFIVWRNAGETHSVISGYRHGLFWNSRAWVQFCTDTKYCG